MLASYILDLDRDLESNEELLAKSNYNPEQYIFPSINALYSGFNWIKKSFSNYVNLTSTGINFLERNKNKLHHKPNKRSIKKNAILKKLNDLTKNPKFIFTTFVAILTKLPGSYACGPEGNEVQVNSYTLSYQNGPIAVTTSNNTIIIAWTSSGQNGGLGAYAKEYTPDGQEIYRSTSGTASAIDNEFPIDTGPDIHTSLSIAAFPNPGRGFAAVWQGRQYISGTCVGSGYSCDNGFTIQAANLISPKIICLSNGNYVAMFQVNGKSCYGVYYAANSTILTVPTSGTLDAPLVQAFPINTIPMQGNGVDLQATSLINGNFVAIWLGTWNTDGNFIVGKVFDANGNVLNEFPIISYNNFYYPSNPCIAASIDGFITAWKSPVGGSIQALQFDQQGSAIGGQFTIVDAGDSPNVSVFSDGSFVAVWHMDLPSNNLGWGAAYGKYFLANNTEVALLTSGTGNARGNAFPISTFIGSNVAYGGSGRYPTMSILPAGRWVVAWTSFGQDNPDGNAGVYATFYASNLTQVYQPNLVRDPSVSLTFQTPPPSAPTMLPPGVAASPSSISPPSPTVPNTPPPGVPTSTPSQVNATTTEKIPTPPPENIATPTPTPINHSSTTAHFPLASKENNSILSLTWILVITGSGACGLLIFSSGVALAVKRNQIRKWLNKQKEEKIEIALIPDQNGNIILSPTPMPASARNSMEFAKASSNLFEALLEAMEKYDERFYLLSTITEEMAKEIEKRTGYIFPEYKYDIEDGGFIGKGNFGMAMFAFDAIQKRFVLCKIVWGEDACVSSEKEAEILKLISGQTGIIELIKSGDFTQGGPQTDIRYVHFLEYMNFGNGEKLVEKLHLITDQAIKFKLQLECIYQLLVALSTLKKYGVYHADLKLANSVINIEIDRDGYAHLVIKKIDFGCSQILAKDGLVRDGDSGDTKIFSPERCAWHIERHAGNEATMHGHLVDTWALGLMLYAIMTGKDPYIFSPVQLINAKSSSSTLRDTFQDRKNQLSELQPNAEQPFNLIDGMLSIDSEQRSDCNSILQHGIFNERKFLSIDAQTTAIKMLVESQAEQITDSVKVVEAESIYYANGKIDKKKSTRDLNQAVYVTTDSKKKGYAFFDSAISALKISTPDNRVSLW